MRALSWFVILNEMKDLRFFALLRMTALIIIAYSLQLTAQEDNHIFIERGSTTELTWKAAGDYTGYDSLYFVVKPCTSNTCARLIQKPVEMSYKVPHTTLTCTLYVDETASFNAARYYYSIYAYGADTVWVTSGNFNLMLNGQTPTDGVPTTSPYYTVALNPPTQDPGFIMGDSSANTVSWISKDSIQTLLGIDTLTLAGSLPDSIIYTSEVADFVTKSTAQTITGQKNFTGTIPIKLGADSSLRIGGQVGGTQTGLVKQMQSGDYPVYVHERVIPADTAGGGDWSVYSVIDEDFDTLTATKFSNYIIAYNNLRKGNKAWMGTGMEPEYETGYLGAGNYWTLFEWWYQFDWPATNIQYTNRPFQVTQWVPYSGNADSIRATSSLEVDVFWIGNSTRGAADNTLDFNFGSGSSYVNIDDTFYVQNRINNIPWLYQASPTSVPIEMIRVDDLSRVVISPSGSYDIKFASPIDSSIRWHNNANVGYISILPDTNDVLQITNADVSVNNLQIRSLRTDTTGTQVGDLYADPLSGAVYYNLGVNILLNGDFTDWTGVGKGATPDNWTMGVRDSVNNVYVEENPTGELHFVCMDSLSAAASLSQAGGTAGVTYGYSFNITELTLGGADIRVGGNIIKGRSNGVDDSLTAGVYSGETTAINTSLFSINQSGDGDEYFNFDLVIDNIKIWVKGGAKQTPYITKEAPITMLNITTDDTLFLGYKNKITYRDSIRIFDIQDSIAIQLFYRTDADYDLISTPDTLTTETTIVFDTSTVPAEAKLYLCFIYLGDSEAYLRSQIYWRE